METLYVLEFDVVIDPAATTADKGFSWLEFWGGRTSECGRFYLGG